jgi:hypothetical protein
VYGVWMSPTDNRTDWPPAGSRGFRALLLVQMTICKALTCNQSHWCMLPS